MAKKYYVVWQGKAPGIYDSWELCQEQVKGFSSALFKAFPTRLEAEKAFAQKSQQENLLNDKDKITIDQTSKDNLLSEIKSVRSELNSSKTKKLTQKSIIITPSIAVDASCLGNPGIMEYQGVDTESKEQIFHQGPFQLGTNNIGEFLALVHALAFCKKNNDDRPIYSDSVNAIMWVRAKKCRTKMLANSKNADVFALINRAEIWLQNNLIANQIIKWDTNNWGEIPADFGRK